MGAILDINVISKKYINPSYIKYLLESEFKLSIKIQEIEIIDNWEFSNSKKILNIEDVEDYILNNKIANIISVINGKYSSGIQIEKIKNIYSFSFWVDTEYIPCLDSDTINNKNKFFYNLIKEKIVQLKNTYEISIASIGLETIFKYDENIKKIIKESTNISMFLFLDYDLLKKVDKNILTDYTQKGAMFIKKEK